MELVRYEYRTVANRPENRCRGGQVARRAGRRLTSGATMAVAIGISDLVKSFGPLRAVDGVTLEINPGELFFLLGPSGCGKTTLLRSVAGFHQPDSGTITIGTRDVTRLAPWRRDTGMVFQSYALWPHMTVARNVASVSRCAAYSVRHPTPCDRGAQAVTWRACTAKPNQLSGGQQQRAPWRAPS